MTIMERVKTLVEKLNEQLQKEALIDDLLHTVKMLQSELNHIKGKQQAVETQSEIYVQIPPVFERKSSSINKDSEKSTTTEPVEEKKVEILQMDEAEVAAELEAMKKNAADRNKIQTQSRPPLLFDPVDDIPTLAHQQPAESKKELNERISTTNISSLNDKLKAAKVELSDTLKDSPIKDLKKAIGINDRFLFIKELFKGDEVMYERSIKTINGFAILPEAEYWIRRELKLKLAWKEQEPVVKQFDQLVKRRFA